MTTEETTEIKITLARLEEKFDAIIDRQEDIEHCLYGNGQPGIKQKVTELTTTVRVIQWAAPIVVSLIGIGCGILGMYFGGN